MKLSFFLGNLKFNFLSNVENCLIPSVTASWLTASLSAMPLSGQQMALLQMSNLISL